MNLLTKIINLLKPDNIYKTDYTYYEQIVYVILISISVIILAYMGII